MWWIKKFRKRKVQSILIIAVVMLCTTLIAGSAVILSSLTSVYQELADETNAPDVKVYSRDNFTTRSYKEPLENTGVVKKVVEIPVVTVSTILVNNEKKDVFLDICKMNQDVYGDIRVINGSLDEISDTKCAFPEAVANSLGASLGDTIQVQVDGVPYEYTIVATYAEIYSAATQYTCDMLVTSLPTSEVSRKVCSVYLKKGVSCDQLIQKYSENNDGIIDGYFRAQDDCIMNAELTELILGGILLGISVVVFFAILLIIGYIIKNCFRIDKKTIAVYKTIGYSNRQIRKIYVTFYIFLIALGSVLGGLCSPLLSNSFIRDVYANVGATGNAGGLPQIVVCILLINGVSLLMLLSETRRIGQMKPVEILNGTDEAIGKHKMKESARGRYNFSPFAMALRMIRRDKKNTCLLLLTCIISIYIVNLSVVCLQNIDLIKGEMNYYWLGIDKHDITIEKNGIEDDRFFEICEQIKSEPEVKMLVRRNFDMGFAIPHHQTTSAITYETFENVDVPIIEGRNPEHSNEIVIGNIYKKELGIDIGDYITLQLNKDCRKDLLVVGTFQGFYNLGRSVKILGSLLDENNINYSYTQSSITLNKEKDKKAFIQKLENTYGAEIKVIDRYHLYESIMDVICNPQKAALLPFVIVTILIGGLNVFYIIYASNIEKRKRYTIYKSLGYTSRHLLKVNAWYVGMIVAVAIIIAVPAFLILFPKIMVLAMSAFGFAEYKLVVKPMAMVITNVSVLVLFLGSAAVAGVDICRNYIAKIMNE